VTVSPDDPLLVLRARCDDREALELLLRRVSPVLHKYVATLVGPQDADDVLQDALVQICRNIRWLEHVERFRAWAFRICTLMADDLEHLVRQSLDAVDRSKRWAAVFTAVLFLVILFALGALMAASVRVDDGGRTKQLFAAVVAQMIFVGLCTSLLAFHVTRMTKAVLRAIELASRGTRSRN
jgi:hypothetical protein